MALASQRQVLRRASNAVNPPIGGARLLPAWLGYLIGGAFVVVLYEVVPALHVGPIFNLVALSSPIAILVGTRRNRPAAHHIWLVVAGGMAFFAAGDLIAYNYSAILGVEMPFPSVSDGLYLLFYPGVAVAISLMARRRRPNFNRAGALDATIIALGVATLSWALIIQPTAMGAQPLISNLVAIAYPVGDLVLLGVMVRLVDGGGPRIVSRNLLLVGTVALLVVDSLYSYGAIQGIPYVQDGVLELGWAILYLSWGAAALHPSMRRLTEASPQPETNLTWARLALVSALTLLAQGVQLVRDQTGASGLDAGIQGAAAIAMVILLLFRFVGVMRRQDHSNRREHALREAGGALVSSIDREAIAAATIRAAKGLAAEHGPLEARLLDIDARRCLVGPAGDALACNLPEDFRAGLERGEIVSVRGSAPVAAALALPDGTPFVALVPLFLDGVLRYGLVVALERRPSIAVGQALLALSLQAGLALEARDLADRLAARRTQAWFESLVHNASDVIVVIDADGIVRFVSPASERVLGRQPEALLDRALTELVIDGERPVVAAWISAIAADVAIAATIQQDTRTLEFGVIHADGRSLMVEAVSSNLLENVAVGGIVLNLRDVSERLAFEAELTRRASHDGLTGLANPALFRERLAQALRSRRDESRAVSVLFIDLDDFKSVNDSLGHGSGDRVLVAVADRLRQSVRGSETVARLGGDEFGILVQGGGLTPTKLAERVLATLATPIGLDESEVTIQASIGIATAGPNERGADLAAELLRGADGAMYAAKNAGKGRWSRFELALPNDAAARPKRRVRTSPAAVV